MVASGSAPQTLLFRQLFDAETCSFTYLLGDPLTGDAALVDPVLGQQDHDLQLLQELMLNLRFCLETNLHADHISAAGQLLRGGDRLQLGSLWIDVIATPGHTPEYVADRTGETHLLSGDSLLIRGCGRTDFQNGDSGALFDSLQQLLKLPDRMVVYPGHDSQGRRQTSIREERECNPRLVGRSREDFIQLMNHLRLAPPKQIAKAMPANRYLCDLIPGGEHPYERQRQENNGAEKIETTNREIFNDFIWMFF